MGFPTDDAKREGWAGQECPAHLGLDSVCRQAYGGAQMIRMLPFAFAVALVLSLPACSSVHPAGSLGYMVNGDPLAPPVPTNYLHVPPTQESRGPLRWQADF